MNALSKGEPILFQKIAVRLLLILIVTVIFLGEDLCFWGTQKSTAAYSVSLRNADLKMYSSETDYRQSQKEINEKLWKISLAARYGNVHKQTVKDGVVHIRMTKYINHRPLKINIIEFNPYLNKNVKLMPVMAGEGLAKRTSVVSMSRQNNAFAAVNGSYFKPQTGVPLGLMMIDKKILTGPIYNRVALGITDNGFKMDRAGIDAELKYLGASLKVNNINQPRMLCSDVLVYTPEWGKSSPKTPKYGIQVAVENGRVIEQSENPLKIPSNGFVISGPKVKIEELLSAKEEKKIFRKKQNTDIVFDIKVSPEWEDVNHIISGGPFLVKDGKVFVDYVEEKFKPITGKNPRTAVGYTKDGYFIMVTIDGREESSVGAGLYELAKIMKSFGCEYAMNLDGGGSSTMQINGQIVNSPSVKGGITVSNSLALVEPAKITLAE